MFPSPELKINLIACYEKYMTSRDIFCYIADMNQRNTLIHRYGFLLMPNFAMMSFVAAIEPLRAANWLAGHEIFGIHFFSFDGTAVKSSSEIEITCQALNEAVGIDTLFVCAGGAPINWQLSTGERIKLQQMARSGIRIGGISSGAFVLAACSLLQSCDFTIHWEHAPLLMETFPDLEPRQSRFIIDGNRITCGGGIAPLDMMHALISHHMGNEFARRVSDWYLHTSLAEAGAPQRASIAERYGTSHPALLRVIEKMEATIEEPLGRDMMARFVNLSSRQLDRLFASHLKCSFQSLYRQIRLNHAKKLLQQSPLSVTEIAFAAGFSSVAHFSRLYRHQFGQSPAATRRPS